MNDSSKHPAHATHPSGRSEGPSTNWSSLLDELRQHTDELQPRSRWSVEWAIHRWASERLPSTAIRIEHSEGLTGSAPARWRLLTHIDPQTGAYALAALGGRAPLVAANVVACLLSSSQRETVIAIRGLGVQRWDRAANALEADVQGSQGTVERALDRALGRPSTPIGQLSLPLRLAIALVLEVEDPTTMKTAIGDQA